MTPLYGLVFGLGLFFLGLRLVGENLRRLSGSGFRSLIKGGTKLPLTGALLGLAAGAVMQSATAVTFILVGMIGTELIKPRAAAPIVLWCNTGLTALAFVTTLNIHPLVALVVGGAGIVLGTVRIPIWQIVAASLLGFGLILVGLEQMGAAAAPLKDAAWFRGGLNAALASAPLTLVAGIAAAAILQSNTGAAMLVITFASGGLITLKSAMLLIYGTNLGAIGLRWFLARGLPADQLRLVRLEDLFCVTSAVMMTGLYALEEAGFPLVAAGVQAVAHEPARQLALVFLLSNLLPALLLSLVPGPVDTLLRRFWPDRVIIDDPSAPAFLHSHALDDPPTAIDQMARELVRLLGTIRVQKNAGEEPAPSFQKLAMAIETFAAKLASRNALDAGQASLLHQLRAELSIIRHVEEGVRYFSQALGRQQGSPILSEKLTTLLLLATRAAESGDPARIEELRARTKLNGEEMKGLEKSLSGGSLADTALFEDFSIAAWTLHRLAKLLVRLPA